MKATLTSTSLPSLLSTKLFCGISSFPPFMGLMLVLYHPVFNELEDCVVHTDKLLVSLQRWDFSMPEQSGEHRITVFVGALRTKGDLCDAFLLQQTFHLNQ